MPDDALDERDRVPVRDPGASHPGVHLDVEPREHLVRHAAPGEQIGELDRVDAGGEPVLDDLVDFGEKRGAQDDDRSGDSGGAKLDALVERGHAQHGDAGVDGVARDLHGAVPVRVRLDDQKDSTTRADGGTDGAEVPAEAIQIDFDPGGEFHSGWGRAAATSRLP